MRSQCLDTICSADGLPRVVDLVFGRHIYASRISTSGNILESADASMPLALLGTTVWRRTSPCRPSRRRLVRSAASRAWRRQLCVWSSSSSSSLQAREHDFCIFRLMRFGRVCVLFSMKRALCVLKTQKKFWPRGANGHRIERIRAVDASKSPEQRNRGVATRFCDPSSFQKKGDLNSGE